MNKDRYRTDTEKHVVYENRDDKRGSEEREGGEREARVEVGRSDEERGPCSWGVEKRVRERHPHLTSSARLGVARSLACSATISSILLLSR